MDREHDVGGDGGHLEEMARRLEASGDYRVLRRLKPRSAASQADKTDARIGILLDVETTGLNTATDEIIELAMLPFRYTSDGKIIDVGEPFDGLRKPSNPIPEKITALTGITDAMVKGKVISPDEVEQFIAPASLIVAHNATFDRKFCERFCSMFSTKAWACSQTQIDWREEGVEGSKLAYIAAHFGFFYDSHRAANDCFATVEILSRPLPKSGMTVLAKLLETARKPTWRLWAENAPYDFKDKLKARGYRWNGEVNGRPRAWYIDVQDDLRALEVEFLRKEIYQRDIDLTPMRITAYDRFSERV